MLEDPQAADEKHILRLLEEEFRELTVKEAEVLRQLNEIRAGKQRVQRLVAEKTNSYTPILTLPDELLVSIVQETQQSNDPGARVEVIMSHVSQRFRWAVIGAASLWRSLDLRWGVDSDEERLAAYLTRSRPYLLSIQLNYDDYHGREGKEYSQIRNQLATVARHISRIRRLVLRCDGLGLPRRDAVIHFENLHAPFLEYLDIRSFASELDSEWEPPMSIFNGGAPRLSTVKMDNIVAVEDSHPWLSALSRLDFRGIATRGGINPNLLANCRHLTELTLDYSTFSLILGTGPPLILMPALRCLRALGLDDQSRFALIGILTDIHAPALETLQFSGAHINSAQIASFFNFEMLPSKLPTLNSLTFANSNVDQVCYDCVPERIPIDILKRFTALESLTVVNICDTNVLMADLLAVFTDADGARSSALPSLRTVTLRYKDIIEFGNAGWPNLSPSLGSMHPYDPLQDLRRSIAALRQIRPIHLRLPRSRFFTERDWDLEDANFELFDSDLLMQSLGYRVGDYGVGEFYSSHSTLF
ncbi:hypothetical protein C8R45DRAFT_1024521 [Mycena sanguinolenta]|nr:hypothetical protein C8R45DRAFT_1024521 [Mycena sanguinolenta]